MNDVLLGLIAAGVVIMAVIQVAAVVFAARAARRLNAVVDRLEQDIRPVITNLQGLTADAARAAAIAAGQVERADRLFADLARRIEQTLASVQETLAAPTREGFGWLSALKAVFTVLQDLRGAGRGRRAHGEEDEALFIG